MAVKSKRAPSPRREWRALPKWQRTATLILVPIEIAATTLAVVDLARRPRDQIRGPKAFWWPALTVQPFGPFAYLAFAPRRFGRVAASSPRPVPVGTAVCTHHPRTTSIF